MTTTQCFIDQQDVKQKQTMIWQMYHETEPFTSLRILFSVTNRLWEQQHLDVLCLIYHSILPSVLGSTLYM